MIVFGIVEILYIPKKVYEMKIKLKTDFLDYYDHWFCGSWEKEDYILDRRSTTEMSKIDQFKIIENCGLSTPSHGYIKDLVNSNINNVVVYTNLYSHAGENKELCSIEYANKCYGDLYGSEYINQSWSNGIRSHWRYLAIGGLMYMLHYSAKGGTGWQSNKDYEDIQISIVDINIIREGYEFLYNLSEYPIFALDFVLDKEYKKFYIDFNTAPKIYGTGLENELDSNTIYNEIEEWVKFVSI